MSTPTGNVSGPQILRSIDVRYFIKSLVIKKPELEVLVPALQAVGNEVGAAFAVVSLALQSGRDITPYLSEYVNAIKAGADKRTQKLGITHSFTYNATVGAPLSVSTTVNAQGGSATFGFTFGKVDADFSDEYVQGLGIGKERWALYVNSLTVTDLDRIFSLAAEGYEAFLEGQTPKIVAAKLKHRIAMEAAKGRATEIIQAMRQAVERYFQEAVSAKDKYKARAQFIAYPAVMYGLEYVKAAVQVLVRE